MCACKYACMHMYISVCMHVYACMCRCMCVSKFEYMCTWLSVCECIVHVCIYIHIYIHTPSHTHIHMSLHVYEWKSEFNHTDFLNETIVWILHSSIHACVFVFVQIFDPAARRYEVPVDLHDLDSPTSAEAADYTVHINSNPFGIRIARKLDGQPLLVYICFQCGI